MGGVSTGEYMLRPLVADGTAVGAFLGEEAVAYGVFAPAGAGGDVRLLGATVLPEHRGRGLYRRLVALRLREAERYGAARVLARVRPNAPDALAVLLQRGFVIVAVEADGTRGVARDLEAAPHARHRSALLIALADAGAQAEAVAGGLVGRELIRHGPAAYVLFGDPD